MYSVLGKAINGLYRRGGGNTTYKHIAYILNVVCDDDVERPDTYGNSYAVRVYSIHIYRIDIR